MHDPVSRNCAIIHVVHCTLVTFSPHKFNSIELHQHGVAPRSKYSDHTPEAITLQ